MPFQMISPPDVQIRKFKCRKSEGEPAAMFLAGPRRRKRRANERPESKRARMRTNSNPRRQSNRCMERSALAGREQGRSWQATPPGEGIGPGRGLWSLRQLSCTKPFEKYHLLLCLFPFPRIHNKTLIIKFKPI